LDAYSFSNYFNQDEIDIVYITAGDKMYHKEDCSKLPEMKTGIPRKNALEAGFIPCFECMLKNGVQSNQLAIASNPNLVTQDINKVVVYITGSGKKYHTANCRYIREYSSQLSLQNAIKWGYEPCAICNPPVVNNSSDQVKNIYTPPADKIKSGSSVSSSSDKTIYTGPRGGKYYINSKGKKVYVKKKK
jgi:hypothetical protein